MLTLINDSKLLIIILILLVLALIVLAFIAFKVRKVHLASYNLVANTSRVRKEVDVLFSQLQSLFALERRLGMEQALPPMRGWVGSPDFLLFISDETSRIKPRVVVECSSGVSTLVVARCLQMNGGGHVYSLEHEPVYAAKTRAMLVKYGLSEWATVLDAPLVLENTDTPWYDLKKVPVDIPPIDILVVDGPPFSIARLARFPALPMLMSRMSSTVTVILDDADRDDEREIVDQWNKLYPNFKVEYLPSEKGLAVLRYQ